jgi:hypothetical protein
MNGAASFAGRCRHTLKVMKWLRLGGIITSHRDDLRDGVP